MLLLSLLLLTLLLLLFLLVRYLCNVKSRSVLNMNKRLTKLLFRPHSMICTRSFASFKACPHFFVSFSYALGFSRCTLRIAFRMSAPCCCMWRVKPECNLLQSEHESQWTGMTTIKDEKGSCACSNSIRWLHKPNRPNQLDGHAEICIITVHMGGVIESARNKHVI